MNEKQIRKQERERTCNEFYAKIFRVKDFNRKTIIETLKEVRDYPHVYEADNKKKA